MTRYRKTFAEAYKDVYENAATDMNQQEIRIRPKSAIEKIQPFMISYSKDGKHAGFEGGDTLQDIQNKAQKLRAKGFTIDKMGRNNPPVKEEYIEEIDEPKDVPSISKENKPNDEEKPKEKEPKKDPETLEAQIITLKGQLSLIKQKLENEKNKVVKPQPNKETGEVPLRTGIANAILDKKIDTKKIIKSKKKEEIPVGGKTKIEVNPNADIGVFSGGVNTNLH